MALLQSARLVPCTSCGRHGTIIFSDGEHSAEITSKHMGYFSVAYYLGTGKIIDMEANSLREQIDASKMFDTEFEHVVNMVVVDNMSPFDVDGTTSEIIH